MKEKSRNYRKLLKKQNNYVKIIEKKKGHTNMDCLFCAIIKGEIPSKKVYEDENCFAFLDIAPQAPVHCLVIPKEHIQSVDCVNEENAHIVGKIFAVIPKIAATLGLENGYRVITNVGEDGAQSVKHMHFHILGGKKLPESIV